MVDWSDSKKRKAFREALQSAYPSPAELSIFVNEELDENLAELSSGDNLKVIAYDLLEWARSQEKLDDVYEAFKQENPDHSKIAILEREDLIPQKRYLSASDWDSLFAEFRPQDCADIRRAFFKGFKVAWGADFNRIQAKPPVVNVIIQVRELLEGYDSDPVGPTLAVRFVEAAITELQRSNEGSNRDLARLEQWRDRVAQRFDVQPPPPSLPPARHAYLLIAIQEQGADWIIYPELRLDEAKEALNFGGMPATCPAKDVSEQISELLTTWINQAEQVLETEARKSDGEAVLEVVLEIFLPCSYLEQDIAATWRIKDRRGDEVILENHRPIVIRSFDRIHDYSIQQSLQRRWKTLKACVDDKTAHSRFHRQTDCPTEKGALCATLKDEPDAPGLKLLTPLPDDSEQRRYTLYGIIDAALPIALWSSEMTKADVVALEAEFDTLLRSCRLMSFADLATQWRKRRRESETAKPIRLLCDHPMRQPDLPDLTQDSDLLVAS